MMRRTVRVESVSVSPKSSCAAEGSCLLTHVVGAVGRLDGTAQPRFGQRKTEIGNHIEPWRAKIIGFAARIPCGSRAVRGTCQKVGLRG